MTRPRRRLLLAPASCAIAGIRLRGRESLTEAMDADADSPRMFGCGLFRRRRARSTSSIPALESAGAAAAKRTLDVGTPRQRKGSDNVTSIVRVPVPLPAVKAQAAPAAVQLRRPRKEAMRALPAPATAPAVSKGIVAELDGMLYDRQRAAAAGGGHLLRASSGNVMVYGNLGNLRGNPMNPPRRNNMLDSLPKTVKELREEAKDNEIRASAPANRIPIKEKTPAPAPANRFPKKEKTPAPAPELCRALSTRQNPEELKEMGNEEYKKGSFAENPGKASYYVNKAAALAGMGRLFDAVAQCNEAIRIDPAHYRAHHRLASLYLRLGEADKAVHHFKQSRDEASAWDKSRAQALQSHISKSNEARRLKDYLTLLKESQSAASSGADSSPQVFAMQADALLKLQKHEDADSTMSRAPELGGMDEFTKFFGATANSYFLMIQAQVDIAAGRFEEAAEAAQKAARLDPGCRETAAVARRARAVASASARGNDLFKASKFAEACVAYGEGLNHDPQNASLLFNRATCRSELGHYEKAVEDCNAALALRPSYGEARRRRADSNAKLERWEAAAKDYGALAAVQENPGDEEVAKAKAKLKKKQDERSVD
ncbi:inactive TPR repeat-containing thioredoxin TTL3-like [Zingiber officinale]|uniref:inactive TPR repeat-containing thioredoxin TTL3-like n=1 Tax=Zingiber officinale TaxID=94328 RepID=UPI001C4AFA47|nr:inactive TPR repeat-containing thioredoxin TTL3-like [Zingiber officinale]